MFPIVKLDEGENQCGSELEQSITRLADELADPGPRGKVDFVPLLSEAGALIVADDYLNNDSNIFIGNDNCDAIIKGYDEPAIDAYSDVIGDYDYDAVNGIDGTYETDSLSYLICTYENDVVIEVDDDTGESRCDIPESHGDLPRGLSPGGRSPNRIEKQVRKYGHRKNVNISSCQTAV